MAVEGVHRAGKTSSALALAGALSAQGYRVAFEADPARSDPFVEEVVLHGAGEFDLCLEASLFTRQVSSHLAASRLTPVVVCDKTPVSCLAYTKLLIPESPARDQMLHGFRALIGALAEMYAVVFMLKDRFDEVQKDPFRSRVTGLEDQIASELDVEFASCGLPVVHVEPGMNSTEKTSWMVKEASKRI